MIRRRAGSIYENQIVGFSAWSPWKVDTVQAGPLTVTDPDFITITKFCLE